MVRGRGLATKGGVPVGLCADEMPSLEALSAGLELGDPGVLAVGAEVLPVPTAEPLPVELLNPGPPAALAVVPLDPNELPLEEINDGRELGQVSSVSSRASPGLTRPGPNGDLPVPLMSIVIACATVNTQS